MLDDKCLKWNCVQRLVGGSLKGMFGMIRLMVEREFFQVKDSASVWVRTQGILVCHFWQQKAAAGCGLVCAGQGVQSL